MTELEQKIQRIPAGKTLSIRTADTYVQVANRPEGLVVECGWVVPERHEDDANSYTYCPFKGRSETPPWVGKRYAASGLADAATIYADWKEAVAGRRVPTGGEKIGSVIR